MMHKVMPVVLVIAFFISIACPLYSQGLSSQIKLDNIIFFEGGYEAPDESARTYTVTLPKSTTRFVWTKLQVVNLLYEKGEQKHHVLWKYYNPDGSLRGEVDADFTIQADWYTAWISHGWGWDEPGNWPVGNYRVELWVDNQKFGENYFSIYEDRPNRDVARTDTFEFDKVLFYEDYISSKEEIDIKYTTKFPKSTTRAVWSKIFITNLEYEKEFHTHKATCKYYNPRGRLFGEVTADFPIKPEWHTAWLPLGWGWDEPGNWEVGTYSVEVWIDGKMFTDQSFVVYDDTVDKDYEKTAAVAETSRIEFDSLKFFETGYEPAPMEQRVYDTRFDHSKSRYIFYEVLVKNLLYNIRGQNATVRAKYYLPTGELMGEMENNQYISPEWEYFYFWHGWGFEEAGHWPAGTYRVELFFGDRKATEGRFVIY